MNIADLVTIVRIIIVIIAVKFLHIENFNIRVIAFFLIIITTILDWVDGYVARKYKCATDYGSIFDIIADRFVELALLFALYNIGLIYLVFPIIFLFRGILTDSIRIIEVRKGRTAFGKKTMLTSKWGKMLAASRFSRGVISVSKLFTFLYFTVLLILQTKNYDITVFVNYGFYLMIYVTSVNVIRGIPVIYELKRILKK